MLLSSLYGNSILDTQVAAETPQSIVHYDELPAEHQYARPVSPTKFSGRYGDGYDYLLPKKEVKLASGKSEQSRPDILLLYPETDQDQSEEAKIQDERSTNEVRNNSSFI